MEIILPEYKRTVATPGTSVSLCMIYPFLFLIISSHQPQPSLYIQTAKEKKTVPYSILRSRWVWKCWWWNTGVFCTDQALRTLTLRKKL